MASQSTLPHPEHWILVLDEPKKPWFERLVELVGLGMQLLHQLLTEPIHARSVESRGVRRDVDINFFFFYELSNGIGSNSIQHLRIRMG